MKRRFPFLSYSIVVPFGCILALYFLGGSCHAAQPDATDPFAPRGNPLYALHISPTYPIHLTTTLPPPGADNMHRATPFHPTPPQCPYDTWKRAFKLPILGNLHLRLFCVPAGRRPGD
jgi:hypothetical protein